LKIKKINIGSFGKLKNTEILLSDKINIIFGENEAGKSTLISFIKVMIFGMNSKGQNIQNNFRKKYLPWSNDPMHGSVVIEKDNEELIITRSFGESKRFDKCEIKSNVTGEDKKNGIISLSEDSFDKTAYFSQLNFKVNGERNEEITSRLMNLKSTGEEEISYEKGLKRLKDIYRSIIKKGGVLESLLLKKIKIQEDIIKIQEIKDSNIENITLLRNLIKKREKINNGYSLEDKNIKEELIELKESLLLEEELVFSMAYFDNTVDEKEIYKKEMRLKEIQNIIENYKKIKNSYKIYNKIYAALFISIPALVISIICLIAVNFNFIFFVIVLTALTAGLFFALIYYENKIKNNKEMENLIYERKYIEGTLKDFYEKYEVDNYMKFVSKLNQYRESKSTLAVLRSKIKEKEMELEKTIAEEKGAQLIKIEREILELNNKIQNAFSLYENQTSFEEQLDQVEKDIKFYKNKSLALEIAIKELENAFNAIQSNFVPKLNEEISRILYNITNEKYKDVKIGGNLEVNLVENGNDYLKESDYFSMGTLHQIYFALRIGILNLIDNENLPLLLDEPFTQYDDKRVKAVLKFLAGEKEKRQVILFTCQKREIDILKELCDLNIINL